MEMPLFPLHAVLFPGAPLPLQIFEPRYKAMMDRVLAGDRRFGVAAIRAGVEVGGPADVHTIGCIAEIERVQRAADGTMQLIANGVGRFRIIRRGPDDPYPVADVEEIDEHAGDVEPATLTVARAAMHRYLSAVARLSGEEVLAPALADADPIAASFRLAAALQLDVRDAQALLEAADARERLELITQRARSEAILLEAVGPSIGMPGRTFSEN